MTDPLSRPFGRNRRGSALRWAGVVAMLALAPLPGTAASDSLSTARFAGGAGGVPSNEAAADRVLEGLGLENTTVVPGTPSIAYENRRYRHSAEARGLALARLAPSAREPITVFERRLGLAAAAIVDTGGGVPAAVWYPSDRGWPLPPAGPVFASTRRTVDLELVPLFSYELGRILDPVLVRVELQPRVRYNPWRGARATASLIIPLRNDFPLDSVRPDIDRVRPGPLTLEQFGWLPGGALVSGTAGIFGSNRYGLSLGAARPLARGAFLLDAQADITGYLAFPATGTEYSELSRFTGFAGVTYRPPALDLAVRLRAQRFLYGDQGAELELSRSMGDLDIAFFVQRTSGFGVQGIRIDVPIPPLTRPTGRAVRALPVARIPLAYRDEAAPVGRAVSGVASREEFLRQLSLPGLAANAARYRREGGERTPGGRRADPGRVSLTGMTGFINTPWCGVMADRSVEVGYNRIPRGGAYDHRGEYRNDLYYAALGFLPRVEAGLRWTVIPGLRAFVDEVPDSRLVESDRMLSGRVELLAPRARRPGLAIGIEDAVGTRRFHSTYAVAGIPASYRGLRTRFGLGYAPRVFTASRHTLDGAFGAAELALRQPVAVSVEYDTERWNTALGVDFPFGFRARAALLNGRFGSFGAGWLVSL